MGEWMTTETPERRGCHVPPRAGKPRPKGRSLNNFLQPLLVKQGDVHWIIPMACSTPNLPSIYKFLVRKMSTPSPYKGKCHEPLLPVPFQVMYTVPLGEKRPWLQGVTHPSWIGVTRPPGDKPSRGQPRTHSSPERGSNGGTGCYLSWHG